MTFSSSAKAIVRDKIFDCLQKQSEHLLTFDSINDVLHLSRFGSSIVGVSSESIKVGSTYSESKLKLNSTDAFDTFVETVVSKFCSQTENDYIYISSDDVFVKIVFCML